MGRKRKLVIAPALPDGGALEPATSSALTLVLASDAKQFQAECRKLRTKRRRMKERRNHLLPLPFAEPKLSALRGQKHKCSMEEATELLELGEHEFARKHGLADRRKIIARLRYAACHHFNVGTERDATQKAWEWLQMRLHASTAIALMQAAENDIIRVYGDF